MRASALNAASGGERRMLMDTIGMAIAEVLPESYRGAYQPSTFSECQEVLRRVRQG